MSQHPPFGIGTTLIHGGLDRTPYGETSEAMFLTSGFVYDDAEQAEATAERETFAGLLGLASARADWTLSDSIPDLPTGEPPAPIHDTPRSTAPGNQSRYSARCARWLTLHGAAAHGGQVKCARDLQTDRATGT